jgi:hypothetical protein
MYYYVDNCSLLIWQPWYAKWHVVHQKEINKTYEHGSSFKALLDMNSMVKMVANEYTFLKFRICNWSDNVSDDMADFACIAWALSIKEKLPQKPTAQ